MKKNLTIISILVIICSFTGWSSIKSPHWGELVTCGKKYLIGKTVIVTMNNKYDIKGIMLDYTTADLKLRKGDKIYVIPLCSIDLIRYEEK